MIKRFTDKHPVMSKLNQIFTLMDELNIRLDICRNGQIVVKHEGMEYDLLDSEAIFKGYYHGIPQLPPQIEYKLLYESVEKKV